ncbi:protein kinase domain-containing protein [Pirellulaceae bacterium SH449]
MVNPTSLQTECCNEETLQEYWNGRISDDRIAGIEAHLAECSRCGKLLAEIESHAQAGDLVKSLRIMAESNDIAESNNTERPSSEKQIGPYRLLEPLGQGGMATVFIAEHTKLRKPVALKLVRFPKHQIDARARFEREILAIGKLHHPSIVSATDAGQDGDLQYLVMELVRGLDLSRLVRRLPALSVPDVCEIGRQTAMALAYAHAQGFVHRDIKPSNIILDEHGSIKVLDFGLVMFDQWDSAISELTTVGQFLGTLDYIAPEQAERSGGVDHRADLYGLGATLFRLLCGRGPLSVSPNMTPFAKLRLLANHVPPKLQEFRPDAPASLCDLVNRLLQTNPTDRPESAEHVAAELAPMCGNANLSGLIQTAMNTEEQASFEPPDSRIAPWSMPSDSRTPSSDPVRKANPDSSNRSTGGGNRFANWSKWILSALAGFVLYGVIIRWETKEGQLVVESDLSEGDIKLRRIDDGSEQNLKIETGNTVTKLRAGEYQLELASSSDNISIENGSFVIASGQTVIARVRLEPSTPIASDSSQGSQEEDSIEPLYDGLPLSELLKLVRREKSHEKWKVGVIGATALLKDQADQELFEELYGTLREREEFELMAQWRDPRIDTAIVDEVKVTPITERAALLRKLTFRFDLKFLPKTIEWVSQQHDENATDAQELFLAMLNIRLTEKSNGLRELSIPPNALSVFSRFAAMESLKPSLAHLYDDLAVECRDTYETKSTSYLGDYDKRAAVRLLTGNRGSFGSRVWAIHRCIQSRNPELLDLAGKKISSLLAEVPDEIGSKYAYSIRIPISDTGGPFRDLPAYQLAKLASSVPPGWKSEPSFFRTVVTLWPLARDAWEFYASNEPSAGQIKNKIDRRWAPSDPLGLRSDSMMDMENIDVSESYAQDRVLVFLLTIMSAHADRTVSERDLPDFVKWCDFASRFGSDDITTAKLSEEQVDAIKQELNVKSLPDTLNLKYFISLSHPQGLSFTTSSAASARMRDWVRKKIEPFDINKDGRLDPVELRNYDSNLQMSDVDINRDGLADVDELVRIRMPR